MQHFGITILLAKLIILLAGVPAKGGGDPNLDARAALALSEAVASLKAPVQAKAACNCQVTGVCTCGENCDCAAVARGHRARRAASYEVYESAPVQVERKAAPLLEYRQEVGAGDCASGSCGSSGGSSRMMQRRGGFFRRR